MPEDCTEIGVPSNVPVNPSMPALAVDLARVVEERLGDMARAQGVAREEDGLGVVAGLGTEMNRHDPRLYPYGVSWAPHLASRRRGARSWRRCDCRARSSVLLAGLLLLTLPALAAAEPKPIAKPTDIAPIKPAKPRAPSRRPRTPSAHAEHAAPAPPPPAPPTRRRPSTRQLEHGTRIAGAGRSR